VQLSCTQNALSVRKADTLLIDIRFPTALQMMLTLANAERAGYPLVTSEQLARGLGSTASLVRRLLIPLGRDGMVRSSLGKSGGVQLGRSASDITLGDIYRSIVGDKPLLAGRTGVPHLCDVSSSVEEYFSSLAADAEQAVQAMLGERTLEQSLNEVLALKHEHSAKRNAPAQNRSRKTRKLARHQ